MRLKKITLHIQEDIPVSDVGSLMCHLPESGVNLIKSLHGEYEILKVSNRKTDHFVIRLFP